MFLYVQYNQSLPRPIKITFALLADRAECAEMQQNRNKLVQIQHVVKRVLVVSQALLPLAVSYFSMSVSSFTLTLPPACVWNRAEPNVQFPARRFTDQDQNISEKPLHSHTVVRTRTWNNENWIDALIVGYKWGSLKAERKWKCHFVVGQRETPPSHQHQTVLHWHSFQRHL